jgi:hypothetical protein
MIRIDDPETTTCIRGRHAVTRNKSLFAHLGDASSSYLQDA